MLVDISYDRHRYIVIVELSSTAIKILKLQPRLVDRKLGKHTISRYQPFAIKVDIKKLIDTNNYLNTKEFSTSVLTVLNKQLKDLITIQPQAWRILLTGHYRNVKNTDEILKLIESSFPLALKRKDVVAELLTPDEESGLSYLSWKKTFMFEKDSSIIPENAMKLNIDVGGGTTEITFFKKLPFKNTVSLPIGVEPYAEEIFDLDDFSEAILWRCLTAITNEAKSHLYKLVSLPEEPIDLTICTGSTLIVDREDEKNNDVRIYASAIGLIVTKQVTDIVRSIKYNTEKGLSPLGNNDKKILRRLCGLMILKAIMDYSNIDNAYNNLANLRIGAFWQTNDYLKQLNGYKLD